MWQLICVAYGVYVIYWVVSPVVTVGRAIYSVYTAITPQGAEEI
jgi:hypothetical protein